MRTILQAINHVSKMISMVWINKSCK